MRVHLKIALPIIGLVLFGAESYHAFRSQPEIERTPSRYFGGQPSDWIPTPQKNLTWARLPAKTRKKTAVLGSSETDGFTQE
jgi:hypothetical protein